MTPEIYDVLQKYTKDVQKLYGEHLKAVILYGSYARGDYREDSDIDIMVLVDLDYDEIQRTRRILSDIDYDYNISHDVLIMPIVQNIAHFNKWLRAYPFYNNIKREGIELYGSSDG